MYNILFRWFTAMAVDISPLKRKIAVVMVCCGSGIQARAIELQARTVGFNQVELSGKGSGAITRVVIRGNLPRHQLPADDLSGRIITNRASFPFRDTVPISLAEVVYRYDFRAADSGQVVSVETSSEAPRMLLPKPLLPGHPGWLTLYDKAWELTWQRIVTSAALPAVYAYNDYPDNNVTYAWDSSFCTLFQRYASVSELHPGMRTLDNFYSQQTKSGYICRNYRIDNFAAASRASKTVPSVTSVNPPLFAWAEWNNYLVSPDRDRLAIVLPKLIANYEFVESFMQTKPGFYEWDGDGSGWDNILKAEKHHYWVELPAMQALAARTIGSIAAVLGLAPIEARFATEYSKKAAEMEAYWNADSSWYCSLANDGSFTGKTLSGMWPVLAGLVSRERVKLMVEKNLMSPRQFLTVPMPLPTIAKDSPGFDPKGAYWLGGVWINMSYMTIRALKEAGFDREAFELTRRTLDGILGVYDEWNDKRNTLWECYASEFPAPASHKVRPELGSVRSDFGGWTCCLINLLIENVIGIEVNAPANALTWNLQLEQEHGLENLRFGRITTSLRKNESTLTIRSDAPYELYVIRGGSRIHYSVLSGTQQFQL